MKYLLKWTTVCNNKYERWFSDDSEIKDHINYLINNNSPGIKFEIYSIKEITEVYLAKINLENQLEELNKKLK